MTESEPVSTVSSDVDRRRPARAATAGDVSSAERLFARELRELRSFGFAEALPLSEAIDTVGDVLRLECGSIGVAVEFREREAERNLYRVVSLAPHGHADPAYTSSRWRDIMSILHSRMRPNDND